ncbi:PRC and DUF2382 domain-containing protein [Nocardia otitidiscaviarum]|uniref:PRC and DUF2382 domain-containing protein n=1 Tax=Nocardia otitidiscaviarum TaxID=1823 RepID=UPI001894A6E8|nr:PRC and DUF2382 domain-containing protein [Nocardia otitidiscaviarum]MBF6237416.1 PRC and DUF2382 domain-containing protein [Nocardia otitidiscaviarum]
MTGLLDEIIGNSVYDRGGDKIGKVKQIYIDNTSGAPTWAAVSTGFFHDDSLVPLAGARHEPGSDALQVQVAKDEVKSAPHVDLEPEISVDDERELFTHYHLDPRGAGWDAGGGPGYDRRADDEMIRSEERLEVDRERATTGRARLRKYVVTEEQTVTVPTTHEEVRIEREPITDPRTAEHADIGDEEREVTLHEDRLTVDTEAVPVERARLAVDEVEDSRTVSGTVRKERFETEGVEDDPNRER